jgi:hypothetical protein
MEEKPPQKDELNNEGRERQWPNQIEIHHPDCKRTGLPHLRQQQCCSA